MKKYASILLCLCLFCGLAAGCSDKVPDFIDLTAMNDTMRTAELTNITSTPERYRGKTIKAAGTYQVTYYEQTKQFYHGILIADAAACCQQGLEFKWDGTNRVPEDYPREGTPIEISGVYDSYREMGKTYYYLKVDEIVVVG